MEIQWKVSDGYVNNGPHTVKVDDEELLECDCVGSAMDLIEDAIEEKFNQTVSTCYERDKVQAQVQALFQRKPKEPVDTGPGEEE